VSDYFTRNLGFTYDGAAKPVLRDINARIPEGKITLLSGNSGAGKSTFIEVLTHIAPEYHSGKVEGGFFHGDEDLGELSLKEMGGRIGLVFQDPESQFCTYTVADELAFGLENLRVSPAAIEVRTQEALMIVGITHLRDRPLHTLSGGEKQKVAVASAIALCPPLLIFDEPAANLDPSGAEELFDLILRLKDEGKTILIVEHRWEGLRGRVDHLLVLDDSGRLAYNGVPCDAWLRPPVSNEPRVFFSATKSFENAPEALSCRALSLRLGEGHPLREVNLSVRQGEFMALIGPNGAGKTTLLHSLLGLYKEAKGEVRLFGRPVDMNALGAAKWREAGIVFQNPEWQFVTDNVEDEIRYSLKKSSLGRAEKDARVRETLERFGLWEQRAKNPFTLSWGEKRRLSVAALLAGRQRLLLLDEPTFGQDAQNREELARLMERLSREGVAILMVTHDMDLVSRYCSRAALLCEGKIVFDGTPEEAVKRMKFPVSRSAEKLPVEKPPPASIGGGLLYGLNPVSKICMLFMLAVPATFSASVWYPLGLLILLTTAGWVFAGLSPFRLAASLRAIAAGSLCLCVFLVFSRTMARGFFLRSDFVQAVSLALRMLGFAYAALLFTRTTDPVSLTLSLIQRWRLPCQAGYAFLVAWRFVPAFAEEFRRIRIAREVRGVHSGGGVLGAMFRAPGYLIPLLIHAIRQGERAAISMDARAFCITPDRTYYKTVPYGRKEHQAIFLCALGLALYTVIMALFGLYHFSIGFS
jgi:energy-coupling factor transport system ATP-binding protein